MQFFSSFFSQIAAVNWIWIFTEVRVVFIVLDALIVVGIVFFWKKGFELRPDLRYPKKRTSRLSGGNGVNIQEAWMKIMSKTEKNQTAETLTVAIIEADKLLDDVLRLLGFQGEHLAERLDRLDRQKRTKSTEKLWQAHRIRNNLVHAQGFNINLSQSTDVLSAYENFFREIKVL